MGYWANQIDVASKHLRWVLRSAIYMLGNKAILFTLRSMAGVAIVLLLFALFMPYLGVSHRTEIVRGPFQVETPGSSGLLVFLEKNNFPKKLFDTGSDFTRGPNGSTLRLTANGIQLGPAHSQHDAIRRGDPPGSFSHWGDHVLFSLPNSLSNTSDLELVIDYDLSLKRSLIQMSLISLIAILCLLILRQYSLNRTLADLLSAKVFRVFWAISRVSCMTAIVSMWVFFVSCIYGLFDGYALPNTIIFFQADIFRTVAKLEPTLPHVVLIYAMIGFLFSLWALLSPENRTAYRLGEDRLALFFGNWGFFLILGWLLFSLGGSWAGVPRPQDFNGATLAGLIPFSDAADHFDASFLQTYTGDWGFFGSRRPVASTIRSIMMFIVGYSLPCFLLLQAILLATVTYYAVRSVIRWRGVWAGYSFLGLVMLIMRPYVQTTLTEPLGVLFALASIPFLIRSFENNSLQEKLSFLAFTVIALSIRMGNMFFIPLICLWMLFSKKAFPLDLRRTWQGIVLIISAALFLNLFLFKLYGASHGAISGNFSYVFCGLTHGGNWTKCPELYGEEAKKLYRPDGSINESLESNFYYKKAFEQLQHQPNIFFERLVEGAIAFLASFPPLLLRGYTVYSTPTFFPETIWFLVGIIGLVWLAFFKMTWSEIAFWLFFIVSLIASASVVFFDDGLRILCVSYPVFALFLASGFSNKRGLSLANQGPTKEYLYSRNFSHYFRAKTISLFLFICLLLPWTANKLDIINGKSLLDIARQRQGYDIFLPSRYMTGFLVIPDGAPHPKSVPAIEWTSFRILLDYSLIEQYEHIASRIPPSSPFALAYAIGVGGNQLGGSIHLVMPPEVLANSDANGWKLTFSEGVRWRRIATATPLTILGAP